jgi:hypothetical protein
MTDVFDPSAAPIRRPSILGVVTGVVLVLLACGLAWLTETVAVDATRAFARGGGGVVSVAADRVDPTYEGRLVHVTGRTRPTPPARDVEFLVTSDALKLVRTVEMYQWLQTETSSFDRDRDKKLGPYRYHSGWADHAVDSSAFWSPHGHQNPGPLPWPSQTLVPERVTLGAFTLSREVLDQITSSERLPLPASHTSALPPTLGLRVWDGALHTGGNPHDPAIGDVRVTFTIVPARDITVVAKQVGATFKPFPTDDGRSILLVGDGTRTAARMIGIERAGSRIGGWIINTVEVLVLWLAFAILLRPFVKAGVPVPMVDAGVRAGTGGFALGAAVSVVSLIVSVAWVGFQPRYAACALAVAAGTVAWLVRRSRRAAV